mmetsp:Transcript_108428/g.337933  ORF Transcript_108428/g.337933 Transcript_108428/m.337933 type:complete len:147 (-) Transcript_108428:36-476(-)|eukprot:CAMPEP_0204569140 /NCGR_PEP_ID=MMETSP0661-20131031/37582_1 /ASSEMBLY_ACC=CAM_ASM_000606 /TAXON_ID=109239 /ORGANISM="Alexandrium margalefi, Strain AMGDE01CS-322" /LENGTH=146 /DNA_ID=CAMNT_0051577223 /DNA_START=87 /DNA_END=527 /DNA_ORIENTATION=+
MAATSFFATLCLAALVAIAGAADAAGATAMSGANLLRAGSSVHAHDAAVRADMHHMMSEETEDDVDFHALAGARGGNLLQAAGRGGRSMDEYIRESEAGLSAALGPRWDARRIEEDANHKTRALLRGISGPRATGVVRGAVSAMFN